MKPLHFEAIVDRQRNGGASFPKDPMERAKVILKWGLAALVLPCDLIINISANWRESTLHIGNLYLWGDADGSVPLLNGFIGGVALFWSIGVIVNAYPQSRSVFVKVGLVCVAMMIGLLTGLYGMQRFVESVYVLPLLLFHAVGVLMALPQPPIRWVRDFGAPKIEERPEKDNRIGQMVVRFVFCILWAGYIYSQLTEHGLSVLSYALSLGLGWGVGRLLFQRPNQT